MLGTGSAMGPNKFTVLFRLMTEKEFCLRNVSVLKHLKKLTKVQHNMLTQCSTQSSETLKLGAEPPCTKA
jgi:hypothetical protein